MKKGTLETYIKEILKEKKVKEGTCGYDRDAKSGKKFSTPGGMPLKRKTIGEDNITFSKGEMEDLHKDGKLKKGKHSFKYKLPTGENLTPNELGDLQRGDSMDDIDPEVVAEEEDDYIMKGFTSSDINNLDVVADDVSDILSNRVPWNKWVKMNNDNKARNVEHALQNLTKSNAVKNLIGKKKEAVISYIVHSLSESVNESTESWEKALKQMAKDKQLKMISKKDKETLLKIAQMMKSANESVNEGKYNHLQGKSFEIKGKDMAI